MSRMGSGLRKSLVLGGVLALVVPLLVVFALPVSAATITVCASGCDYTTIQAAVNAASGGDVIHVYPGTYDESVDLTAMQSPGSITLVTVNNAGTPTPGTVTVHHSGQAAEFWTQLAGLNGDLTIDGFIVHSASPGIDVAVDGGAGANRNVVIQNVTATETEHDGIQVSADGNVTVSNCTASDNAYHGINVTGVGGDVTITACTANDNGVTEGYNGIVVYSVDGNATVTNCTAQRNGDDGIFVGEVEGNVNISNSTGNSNGDEGIDVYDVGGNVTIRNCTAKGNGYDGIEPSEIAGAVEVSACISQDNGDDGIDLLGLKEADSILVNGNTICGNASDGLELNIGGIGEATVAATSADATGNWWGCAGGPGAAGCDTVNAVDGTVYYTPWIDTITASAPASAMAGEPAAVTFQFSDSGRTVFLGQGPGDLHGDPTFIVSTDNGTVVDPGFINEPHGVLAASLIPASSGTATVMVDGPCGLDGVAALGAWEFVPEPGSVLLLGSGLMGLAGYASLRLRKR